jgi:hypothetical protein
MRPIPQTITKPPRDGPLKPAVSSAHTNGNAPDRDRLESRLIALETKFAYLNVYVAKLDRLVARLSDVRE